jgi:O-antigen ligase
VKRYLTENIQFVIICLLWVTIGMFMSAANLVIVPLTLLLFYKKEFETELLIGFLVVLTFSDSRLFSFQWAGQVKNIYILLIALISYKKYGTDFIKVKIHLFILPFILIAAYCIVYSPDISTSVQKTLSYFLLFFSVPNMFSYLYNKYGQEFIKGIVISVFLILIAGLIFKYLSPPMTSLAGRFRGMLGNPNGLAIYCFLFAIFFTIVLEFFPSIFSKNEKILIYAVVILSLLFSGARGSLVSLIIFFMFRYFHKLSPVLGFILLVLITASYELITSNIEVIIYSLGLDEYLRVDTIKSGSGRLVAWQFAWTQIEKSYFFGRGFSFNEYVFHENYLYLLAMGHQGSSAHNAYLTFWLDTGLVGLVAFLGGLISFVFSISKYSISVFPLLYAVLFSNQFESWLTASLNPFTILFLLSLSLIFVVSKDRILSDKQEDISNLGDLEVSNA